MRQFYTVTQKLHDLLIADNNVNVVTIGEVSESDLAKQTIFPLSHIIVGDTALNGSTMTMNFTVICMDVVDINKDQLRSEAQPFYGMNNLQDIYNTQLQVCNRLVEQLRRGDAFSNNFQINETITATPFQDRFENLLAGWAIDISIDVPNTEICI